MKSSIFSLAAVVAVAAAASNDTMVTSTILVTSTSTILSCAPTVTNCPVGSVTEVVYATTTICPATAVHTPAPASTTPAAGPKTLTFYSTEEFTITSCHPTVTNCPVGKPTSTVHTTLICNGAACVKPTSAPVPTKAPSAAPAPAASSSALPYCAVPVTSYVTVTASPSGAPAAPSAPAASPAAPASTVVAVVCPGGASCPATTGTPAVHNNGTTVVSTPAAVPFTGGASAQKAGSIMMAVGLIAALL